jgi:hypothetical protein
MDWHWSSWELLWLSAPILLVMFFALPETSAENILLRRAQRLRRLTSRDDLRSESEIRQSEIRPLHVLYDTLIKPLEINALDPAILFSTFYLGLNYGTFYSFFESFPLVYGDVYGFELVKIGLCYLSVLVGFILAIPSLCAYFYFVAPKRRARMRAITPEECLYPGLYGTFLIPIGLFLFGTYSSFFSTRYIEQSVANEEGSLDRTTVSPLECQLSWCCHHAGGNSCDYAGYLCVSTLQLPTVRWFFIRGKRTGKERFCRGRSSVFSPNVQSSRHKWWRLSVGWS